MNKKQERNELIVELHNKGKSLRQIGNIVGLTYERVRQILIKMLGKSYAQDSVDNK